MFSLMCSCAYLFFIPIIYFNNFFFKSIIFLLRILCESVIWRSSDSFPATNQYIYIYISKDLMWECIRYCHVPHVKIHYLCLSFLEDNSFVDWLVKERLVANKLKEKRRKKNLVSKGNGGKKRLSYKIRYLQS